MAELEDKLDSLASLVISSRQAPPPEDGASALLEPASSSTARQISSPTWPSPPQSSLPPGSVEKEVNLIGTLRDPEIHLDLFRSRMTNQFPFVVVPPAMTAHDLGQSRPLLLKTIIMVTSFVDRASQAVLASEIMDHLSLNMLKKAEKNMDLLQSILVFVAWYVRYHDGLYCNHCNIFVRQDSKPHSYRSPHVPSPSPGFIVSCRYGPQQRA